MKQILLPVIFLITAANCFAQIAPSSIPGLKLWLDGSDVYNNGTTPADGTTVTTWYDKSGNGNNATQFSGQAAAKFYSSQINGKGVLRFARNSQTSGTVYQVNGVDIRSSASNGITIMTVYRQGAQSGDQALWGDDNGNWDRFFFTSWSSNTSAGANNGGASLGNAPPYAAIVSGAGTVNSTRLMTAVYVANVTNGSAIYFNGQLITSFTDNTDPTAAQPNLRIGFDGDDNCYNGDVAEMLVFTRQLTVCEIQQINRYMSTKYGVTFATLTANAGGPTSFSRGGSVTLTASQTGTSYQWLLNNTPISGATGSSYTATMTGDYRVAVTNSCTDTSALVSVAANMTAPGNALNFDGVDDYVDAGKSTQLAATNIKTMECWAKFNSLSTAQEILSKSAQGAGLDLVLLNNNLSVYAMNSNTVLTHIDYPASNLQTGVWYHLAFSWDGATKESMRLYVNGDSVGTRVDVGNINASGITDPAGSTFKIGQWSQSGQNRFFNGTIDEVRIWNISRTQTQVKASMYNTLAIPTTGLVAYYNMDQGLAGGNNTNPIINFAYDLSGNKLNGNLYNFTLNNTSSNWVESYAMVRPTATAATTITPLSFTANWTAPVTGTVNNYYLDVSTSPTFSSFVPGYNGLTVTGNSQVVSGLTTLTSYYYRIRANKTTVPNQGGYSNTINVTTTAASLVIGTVNKVVCNGDSTGSISVSCNTGGTNFYFVWYKNGTLFSNNVSVNAGTTMLSTASVLKGGVYGVAIYNTLNVRVDSQSVTLVNPPVLTFSNNPVNITCNSLCNGSVKLAATGGFTPYKFSFNNSAADTVTLFKNLCAGTYPAKLTDSNGCVRTFSNISITQPAKLVIGRNATNVSCNGVCDGRVMLSVTGGTTPYKYKFNNSVYDTVSRFINVCAGTYMSKVVDTNGCADSVSTIITQPSLLTIATTTINPSCICDGKITVKGSGGTLPYKYNITGTSLDTVTIYKNLCSAIYTATVTDTNGCTASSAPISLIAAGAPTLQTIVVQPSCNNKCDGKITLRASGGTKPYRYTFDNGAMLKDSVYSNLCAKSYTAKVTDTAGCIGSVPATVLTNPLPADIGLKKDTLICKYSSIQINAGIKAPATFSWTGPGVNTTDSIVTTTTAGKYYATINQTGGCTYKDSVQVRWTADTAAKARMLVTSQAYVTDSIVLVNVSDTPYQSLNWSLPAAAVIVNRSNDNAIIRLPTGSYKLKLTIQSKNVCYSSDSAIVVVSNPDTFARTSVIILRDVTVSPNPSTTGTFTFNIVTNQPGKVSIRVFSILGVSLYNTLLNDPLQTTLRQQVTLPTTTKGIFIAVIETANSTEVRTLVIN